MAGINYTSPSVSVGDRAFNGGLNTSAGPLSLKDNESPDLQNVDFNKFGSIIKRNGYAALNTTAISGSPNIDGLHWYEFVGATSVTRNAVLVAGAAVRKMDDLDGTWDDITGTLTITATNLCDFDNFLNEVYITNNQDQPFKWTGNGNAVQMTVPTGLTKAKLVKQYNNYLFLANVTVSGVLHQSRFYWSDLKDTSTWTLTNFIDVSKNDGQAITGMRVLGDRLVIFKERSIYNVFFTGDPDIPFILPGGGKSNSSVGCTAPFSIQEVENGLVFLSQDGFYFYDGSNAFKISESITPSLLDDMNTTKFGNAVSLKQKNKNRYWCALTTSGQTENDRIFVWDWFNNAWTRYIGFAPSAMATFYVSGTDERPYFGDYAGFVYRADTGTDDYPLNATTVIDGYYWTNWRTYDDLINKKGIAQANIYHQIANTTLTFAYSYDFETGSQFSNTFSLSSSASVYGTAVYGTGTYAGGGGGVKRRDLTSRGNVIRFKFSNAVAAETFQIDGMGQLPHLETNQ